MGNSSGEEPQQQPRRRFQFSLLGLLILVSLSAIAIGMARRLGLDVLPGWLFLGAALVPCFLLRPTWRTAYAISLAVLYGPFLATTIYTWLLVSCEHCRETVWKLLPCGPVLLPLELLRRMILLPKLPDAIWFGINFLVSVALLLSLTGVLRICRRWWQTGIIATGVLAVCSWLAVTTLALIRA